jgi:hypothetical protein
MAAASKDDREPRAALTYGMWRIIDAFGDLGGS